MVSINHSGHIYTDRDQEGTTLDDLTYGMRVDETDLTHPTIINLTDSTISNSVYHGLLVNGGTVTLNNFKSIANEDGLLLTNGTVTLTDALISENRRFGIYLKNYIYDEIGWDAGERNLSITNSEISKTYDTFPENNEGKGSGYGSAVDHYSTVNIFNTKVIENEGYGLYLKRGDISIDGDMLGPPRTKASFQSEISRNGKIGLYADSKLETGGVFSDSGLILTIKHTLISANGFGDVGDGYGLKINPGTYYFYASVLYFTGNKTAFSISAFTNSFSKIESSSAGGNNALGYISPYVEQKGNKFSS